MTDLNLKMDNRETETIAVIDGEIVWITLNRPQKANAVSSDLLSSILNAIDLAEKSEGVKAIILKGDGNHFCAGADLKELLEGGPKGIRKLLNLFREVTRRFETTSLAVVGAVHGAARAGGLELLLACDGVIAAEGATIGDAHLLRELIPGGGSSVRLPRAIGHQRAKWMILSAVSISAEKAFDWGIVQDVVPIEELNASARKMAVSLSSSDRSTYSAAKKLLFDSDVLSFEDALEQEISMLETHASSDVFKIGLSKFVGS